MSNPKIQPADPAARTETLSWLFWQMGSAPFVGGGFGHFYAYAPEKFEYPINRYAMEVKRQLDVLDRQLADHPFVQPALAPARRVVCASPDYLARHGAIHQSGQAGFGVFERELLHRVLDWLDGRQRDVKLARCHRNSHWRSGAFMSYYCLSIQYICTR